MLAREPSQPKTLTFVRAASYTRAMEPCSKLEAANPGFGLRAPQIIGRRSRLLGRLKHGAEPPRHLREAQERFRRDIAVVGKDGCNYVDRAGALLQCPPRLAVRLHAGENVVGAGGSWIIVELGRANLD